MATTAVLAGISIYNTATYKIAGVDGDQIDFGTTAVSDFISTGDYRPEEYDQVLAEAGALRPVTIPLRIIGTTQAGAVTAAQALIGALAAANRFSPTSFVWTPDTGTASTFTVYGGSVDAPWDIYTDQHGYIKDATLRLLCHPFIKGPAQNLGSSGSPLVSNTVSPAVVTLSPSPAGDVPGEVVLFVKNRGIITQTVQLVTINATGGSYKLTYNGTGSSQPYTTGLTAANVQTNVQNIVGSTDVTVTGPNGGPYTVTFINTLAYNRIPLIPDASLLTGGSHTMTVAQNGTTPAPIRSLIAAGISQNTTWVAGVDQSTWTLDGFGARTSGEVTTQGMGLQTKQVSPVAHFAAPTLPSDRRMRLLLATGQGLSSGGVIQVRARIVSGSVQAVGEWLSLPQEFDSDTYPHQLAAVDMGAWTFPVGEVGQLGPQGTTVYVEAMLLSPVSTANVSFGTALFVPDDSMLVVETEDTSLALDTSGGVIRVESDTAYDSTGNPLGAVTTGSHIRTLGGRYIVYTSQGYTDTVDPSTPWNPEKVDVWATFTPRYIGLAP